MTNDELTAAVAALREAEAKMTPGPWIVEDSRSNPEPFSDQQGNLVDPGYQILSIEQKDWMPEPNAPGMWPRFVTGADFEEGRVEEEPEDLIGIVTLRNTALPVIDALTERVEKLRKYDPLETGCQWEDADEIAHAVHRACVAIMAGKTPTQEPTNG